MKDSFMFGGAYKPEDIINKFPLEFSVTYPNGMKKLPLYITRVLYNFPVTIVFWNDGTKTMARCSEQDTYCKEAGLAICVIKKLTGGKSFKKLVDDWMPEQYYDNADMSGANLEVTMKDVRYKHKND